MNGLRIGGDHLAVVQRAERLADVVQQRAHDELVVGAVAAGPGGGLEAVVEPIDRVGLVRAHVAQQAEQQVGQDRQVVLVHALQHLEVGVGAVVHPGEVHLPDVVVGHRQIMHQVGGRAGDAKRGGPAGTRPLRVPVACRCRGRWISP